jgi:hypothetical protein
MAVSTKSTPATPAPEDKGTPATEPPAPDDAALTEKITSIVKEVVGSLVPGAEDDTKKATTSDKAPSPRDEEARTRSIVAEAIAAFKGTLDETDKGKAAPAGAGPETKPGAKTGRWIEKHLWGVE